MKYTATVTREGDTWLADVESVPGAHTYARSLEGLFASVREVIILMEDLPDDADVDVDFHFSVDDVNVAAAEEVRRRRAEVAEAEAVVIAETVGLVGSLTEAYSVRDTAAMLGITAGRVSQLAARR